MGNTINTSNVRSLFPEAVEIKKMPKRFLIANFFSRIVTHAADIIDFDMVTGQRRVCPYIDSQEEGTNVSRIGHDMKTLRPLSLRPKTTISKADKLTRQPGQPVQTEGGLSNEDLIALNDAETLNAIIDRCEERQAAELLSTGKVILRDNQGVAKAEVDYGRNAALTTALSGAARWDQAGSDPMKTLREYRRTIARLGDTSAKYVIMGSTAFDAFIQNAAVKDRFHWNQQATMANYRGEINDPMGAILQAAGIEGFEIWTYDDWLIDENGQEAPLVQAKEILILSDPVSGAYERHYGAINAPTPDGQGTQLIVADRYGWGWTQKDPVAEFVTIESNPLVAARNINSTARIKVVA